MIWWWGETRTPGGNSQTCKLLLDLDPEPSCCEATTVPARKHLSQTDSMYEHKGKDLWIDVLNIFFVSRSWLTLSRWHYEQMEFVLRYA